MPAAGTIDVAIEHHVATVTISDDKRMNLMNTPTMERMIAVGEKLKQEPGLRLVVLTGGGEKSFIGGADIREMAGFDGPSARAFITRLHGVYTASMVTSRECMVNLIEYVFSECFQAINHGSMRAWSLY